MRVENQDKQISDIMSRYLDKKFNGLGENISENSKKTDEILKRQKYDMMSEVTHKQQVTLKKKTDEAAQKKKDAEEEKFKKHVKETLTKLQETSTKMQASLTKEISLLDKQLESVKRKKEIDSKKHNLLNVMSGDVSLGRYLGKKLHNSFRKSALYKYTGARGATKKIIGAKHLMSEIGDKGVFKTIRDHKLDKKYRDQEQKILKEKRRAELKHSEEERKHQMMMDRKDKLDGKLTSRATTEQRLDRVRADREKMMRREHSSFREHQSNFIKSNQDGMSPDFINNYRRSMSFTVNAAKDVTNEKYLGRVNSLLRRKAGLDPKMDKALGQGTKFTQLTFKTDADILKAVRQSSKSITSIDSSTKQIAMYLKPKQDTSIGNTRGKLYGPHIAEAHVKKKEEKKDEKKTGLLGKMLQKYLGKKLMNWGRGKKGLLGKAARGLGSVVGDCCCDGGGDSDFDKKKKNRRNSKKFQRRVDRLKKAKSASRMSGLKNAGKSALKGLSKAKLPVIGALLGVGLAANAYASSNDTAERKQAVGSGVGGTAGSVIGGAIGAIGGPLGVIAGATIGGWIGEKIGSSIASKMTSPRDSIPDNIKGNPFKEHSYLVNVYVPKMVDKYKASTDKKEKDEIGKNIKDTKTEALRIVSDSNITSWLVSKIKEKGLDKGSDASRTAYAMKLVEKERQEYQDIVARVIKSDEFKKAFTDKKSDKKAKAISKGGNDNVVAPKQTSDEAKTSSIGTPISNMFGGVSKMFNNFGDTKLGTMIGNSKFGVFLNKTKNFLTGNGFKTDKGTYGSGKFAGVDGTPTTSDDTGKKPIVSIEDYGPGWLVVKREDGTVEKRVGARNWRNNNPGNLNYGEFAKSMGAIGSDGRFAIFPTYAAGRAAKQKLIFAGKGYAGLSLTDAIYRYAPPSENNTQWYQQTVLAAVGGQNKLMAQYNPKEQIAIMNAMQKVEGFKAGQVSNLKEGDAKAGGAKPVSSGAVSSGGTPTVGKSYNKASEGVDAGTLKKDGDAKKNASKGTPISNATSKGSGGNGGGGFFSGAKSFFSGIGSSVSSGIKSASNTVSNAVSSAGNYVSVAADKIKSFLGHGFKTQSGVNYQGMNPGFKKKFELMSADYKAKTGKDILITSGYRSIAEQEQLYRTKPPGQAAKPGSSLHNFGWAMDINSPDANALEQMGIMQKYGFHRPLLSKGETWHIEPIGIDKNAIKNDPKYAKQMEDTLKADAPVTPGGKSNTAPTSPTKLASEGVDKNTLKADGQAKKQTISKANVSVSTNKGSASSASIGKNSVSAGNLTVSKGGSTPAAQSIGTDAKDMVKSSVTTTSNQRSAKSEGTTINNNIKGGNSTAGKKTGVSVSDISKGRITDPALAITMAS